MRYVHADGALLLNWDHKGYLEISNNSECWMPEVELGQLRKGTFLPVFLVFDI